MKRCWRLFSFLVIDRERGQEYLNRMARQGWELEQVYFGLFARFRRTARKDLRYFWDWTDPAWAEDGEYVRLCAEAGWELVETVSYGNLYVSRPGSSPAPIQTDPEIEYERFQKKVLRRMGIGVLLVLLVAAFDILAPTGGPSVPPSVYTSLSFLTFGLTGSLTLTFAFLCLPFWALGGIAYFLLLARRLWVWRKALDQGQGLPPLTPWVGRLWGGVRAAGSFSLGCFFLLALLDTLVNGIGSWGVGLGLILGGAIRLWIDQGKPRRTYGKLVCTLGAAMILCGFLNTPLRSVFPGRLPAAPITTAGQVSPVPRERRTDSFLGSWARWEEKLPDGELSVDMRYWTLPWLAEWYLPQATQGMEPVEGTDGVWSDGRNWLVVQDRTFIHLKGFPEEMDLPIGEIRDKS